MHTFVSNKYACNDQYIMIAIICSINFAYCIFVGSNFVVCVKFIHKKSNNLYGSHLILDQFANI